MELRGHECAHIRVELLNILIFLLIFLQSPCTTRRKSQAITALVDREFSWGKYSGKVD